EATYHLFVINHITGDTLSATTQLVHPYKTMSPSELTAYENIADTGDISYQCKYAINGKIYELQMEFNYAEKNIITGDSSTHILNWQIFDSKIADNLTGYGNIAHSIPRYSFYTFSNNHIEDNENIHRTFLSINYYFYAGAIDLYYFYINGYALSGLAELYATNQYTNIKNGFGIFSSRYSVELDSIGLTLDSLDSLACGNITRHLNFTSSIYNPYYPGCE
ncbi:MAG: hypothetical protein H7Y00_04210, partial [Fimbriimonadaceae bacterium]|nr:hypothetical protein [Chitinophagales bacterium]